MSSVGDQTELSALRQENQDLHFVNAALRQQVAVAQLEEASVAQQVAYLRQTIEQVAPARLTGAATSRQIAYLRKKISRSPWLILRLLGTIKEKILQLTQPKPLSESIGVFLHLYYDDLAAELATYIARVPEPKRIYISTDQPEKATHIAAVFAAAGLAAQTDVRVFPNRGYDVGPFLVGFCEEIRQHDILLRLHGKKSTQLGEAVGDAWRRQLLDSLVGDAERVRQIVAALRRTPDLGMVCPEHWEGLYRVYGTPFAIGSNWLKMGELLSRYAIALPPNMPIDFPSGSMFWCRRQALEPWLRFNFSWESFDESREDVRDASLAHALERLFLFGCGLEGLTWARANTLAPIGR